MIPQAHAYLVVQSVLGEKADLSTLASHVSGNSHVIEAAFLRHVMFGLPLSRSEHREIEEYFPKYKAFVPEGHFGPVAHMVRGVHLQNATVKGVLDLSSGRGPAGRGLPALTLEDCRLEGNGTVDTDGNSHDIMTSLDVSYAHIDRLSLLNSRLSYVCGHNAVVGGQLDLSGIRPLRDFAAPVQSPLQNPVWNDWIEQTTLAQKNKKADPAPAFAAIASAKSSGHVAGWPSDPHDHCWGDFNKSQIQGSVLIDSAFLRAPPPRADADKKGGPRSCIAFEDCQIESSLCIRKGSVLEGGLALVAATIGGDIILSGDIVLRAVERDSVIAGHALKVAGDMLIGPRFASVGRIWLNSTRISGSLEIAQALIDGARGAGIVGEGIHVDGSVTITQTIIKGGLDVARSRIGRELDVSFTGIEHQPPPPQESEPPPENSSAPRYPTALLALSAHSGRLVLMQNHFIGMVDLRNANFDTLVDRLSGYGGAEHVALDGLRYSRIRNPCLEGTDNCVESRSLWLNKDRQHRPQPYWQLAQVLETHGMHDQARDILITKLDRELDCLGKQISEKTGGGPSLARRAYRFVRWLYSVGFGYGLAPRKALGTLAACFAVGALFFFLINLRGAMTVSQQPVADLAYQAPGVIHLGAAAVKSQPLGDIPCKDSIDPLLYAIDVFVPLLDLREEGKCDVHDSHEHGGIDALLPGEVAVYHYIKTIYAVLGWIVTSLAIITFSGAVRFRGAPE